MENDRAAGNVCPRTRWPPGGVAVQRGETDFSFVKKGSRNRISIYQQAPSLTLQLHTAWAHNCSGEIRGASDRDWALKLGLALTVQTKTESTMGSEGEKKNKGCGGGGGGFRGKIRRGAALGFRAVFSAFPTSRYGCL